MPKNWNITLGGAASRPLRGKLCCRAGGRERKATVSLQGPLLMKIYREGGEGAVERNVGAISGRTPGTGLYLTSGFVPVWSDDTPKVRLRNGPWPTSTTARARAGATRVLTLPSLTILSPTDSVMFRMLRRRQRRERRTRSRPLVAC